MNQIGTLLMQKKIPSIRITNIWRWLTKFGQTDKSDEYTSHAHSEHEYKKN